MRTGTAVKLMETGWLLYLYPSISCGREEHQAASDTQVISSAEEIWGPCFRQLSSYFSCLQPSGLLGQGPGLVQHKDSRGCRGAECALSPSSHAMSGEAA